MQAGPLSDEALEARADALGALLLRWRHLWSPAPFKVHRPAWVDEHDDVARWLLARSPATVAALEDEPHAPRGDAPDAWRALAALTGGLAEVETRAAGAAAHPVDPLARRVPARKWVQVSAFLDAAEALLTDGRGTLVEWCAGRGHLGRTLAARLDRPGLLLEKDPELCAPPAGRREREGVAHACVDVLEPEVETLVPRGAALLGLHACGRLTDRLVDVALARGASAVVASPCCPHRLFGGEHRVATSARLRAQGLVLHADELRLAVLDEVVVTPRRRVLRQRELLLRVAVDLLAREATGEDRHFAMPTLPRVAFDQPLATFAPWAAATQGLPLPARWSPASVEASAVEAVRRIRALGAARLLFRRPLELWLVLDRACRLREAGWRAEVVAFCPRTATPRNLLLLARPG